MLELEIRQDYTSSGTQKYVVSIEVQRVERESTNPADTKYSQDIVLRVNTLIWCKCLFPFGLFKSNSIETPHQSMIGAN